MIRVTWRGRHGAGRDLILGPFLIVFLLTAIGCAPALRPIAGQPVLPGYNWPAGAVTVPQLARVIRRRRTSLNPGMAEQIATYLLTYARQQGVDVRLLAAIVSVESGFDPRARSRRGALGLGQLMPDTARRLKVTRPFDIADNLAGTARLLRQLADAWRGHPRMVELVVASYRAGAGQVERWLKGNIPLPVPILEYIGAVNRWYRALEEQIGCDCGTIEPV